MSEKKISGRKGGTQFPHISLKTAIEFANKLVAKIHTEPLPESVILKGVFNNSGGPGKIRASALKQYDLMKGLSNAYDATDLSRAIHSAPDEELLPLLVQACLSPKVFKTLFDTFNNDNVSRTKIRQQVLQLKVHPDSGDKCVKIFVESLLYSGLATENNGDITILGAAQLAKTKNSPVKGNGDGDGAKQERDEGVTGGDESDLEPLDDKEQEPENEDRDKVGTAPVTAMAQPAPKAQFQVALNLDTMDPEKLEKHLKILKRYGVIS